MFDPVKKQKAIEALANMCFNCGDRSEPKKYFLGFSSSHLDLASNAALIFSGVAGNSQVVVLAYCL